MEGGKHSSSQIWLTYALTDVDVPEALTLCFSLRRVLTTRKVGVIVSPKLSPQLKESLHHGFDFFFELKEERNTAGLKEEDFVKVFALSLKPFEKCVFLTPTMMTIKNCDELFDLYELPDSGFVEIENTELDIFIVKPSLPNFNLIMADLQQRNGTELGTYLKNRNTACAKGDDRTALLMSQKYNHSILPQNKAFVLDSIKEDISIVNMSGISFDVDVDEFGLLEKAILKQWRQLYEESVCPMLNMDKSQQNNITDNKEKLTQSLNYKTEPIVIVGMACRYPNANNLEEFWQLLLEGKNATGSPPDFRWKRDLLSSRDPTDYSKVNAGFLQYPVEEFDAKFFGFSPAEMEYLDPQTRLLHELVWEALEDAAVNPQNLRGTNGGVFTGSWTNEYKELLLLSGDDDFFRKYMGNSIGGAAARISFLLGMTGPSIATESGCSAAMVAVHLACRSLQLRETNFALACGVNLILRPFDRNTMPMVLSPDGLCKTFDAKADGFGRAEGCGVLVLKRLSDAVRDGDKIWALIRGSGVSQEGLSKSMGTPTIHSETLAMKLALADANITPEQVSYVEAHGTGTAVGDPMEIASIAQAYHSEKRQEPLLIGSVKTNVGHTESCSGITGIMKTVLAMHHEIIPQHRNFETLNPAIDLEAVPAKIPLNPIEWRRQVGEPRIAGVSSFGITGTDTHVIIEEPPIVSLSNPLQSLSLSERPLHIMKISAKTDEAMTILLNNHKKHLATTSSDITDLSYTGNVGRSDFNHRAILIARSNEEAAKSIEKNKLIRGEASPQDIGKVCFLFTGQGSQYPGMAKQLYETSPVFRMHFEYCERILKETYNIDITQVLWSGVKSAEVSRTIYSQTSIFCVEYALVKLWESWGVKADYALGHSLGEFAAAVCSGILSVEDAIKLVAERSRLIDNLPRGKMLVIKADKQQVDTLMKKFAANDARKVLDYAAINSSDQTVVAGDSELILQFAESCKKSNLKCIVLEATHAFHSKHMDPMLDEYRRIAKTIKNPIGNDCKYISGCRGSLIKADQIDTEYWVQHTREKVLFMGASKKAVELGCRTFIEIGPQPVLSALTMMNSNTQLICLPSLRRNENEWETLFTTLGKLYVKGLEVDWKGIDQFRKRTKVRLPHYPFIGKRYWPDMSNNSSVSLHPLLGSPISNASSSKIFQTNLSLKELAWIKDHSIGDHVIFPGAGYLEMCLAAGLATVESNTDTLSSPTRPMKVENLCIEAPLALRESTSCQVQTVADHNESDGEWDDISVKIFRRDPSETSGKWHNHAKATFSPLPTTEDKEISSLFSVTSFLETLKRPVDGGNFLSQVYDKLASVGLKFGPIFKSVESIWRDEEEKILLAKVKLPDDPQNKYIIHPVILDAMIQAQMMLRPLSSLKRSLYVPIKIGKFVWLSSKTSESCTELYIHASEQDSLSSSSILVDSSGTVLAVMSSVELINTTVKTVESILEQQKSIFPDFWEEVWKPTPSLLYPEAVLPLEKFYTDEFHADFHQKYNIPSDFISETYRLLEKFVYLNFLRGLYEVGWTVPPLYSNFTEGDLFKTLGITDGHFHHYFSFIFEVLQEEGFLQKVNHERSEWKLIHIPPSHSDVLAHLSCPEMTEVLPSRFKSTLLLSKVGENLGAFLQGKVSPLPILFPDESKPKEYPSLADFYSDTVDVLGLGDYKYAEARLLDHICDSQSSTSKFQLKILELGAGTGSYTKSLVEYFESRGTPFEYTYTDISAGFFPAAEERFEKHLSSFRFKKLNLEEDPIEQGFIPEYFDLVIAAEVIHATKDIKESLLNIRILMKTKARLVIQETTRVSRLNTFLFGSLDGYWRFRDLDLRQKYCILEKEQWRHVLQSCGLPVEGVFSMLDNRHSCIASQKISDAFPDKILKATKTKKFWLVFHHPLELVSERLIEKIENVAGRAVIRVIDGEKFENHFSEKAFVLRKREYDDFSKLFTVLSEQSVEIEGMIYCWALQMDASISTQEKVLQPYFNLTKSLVSSYPKAVRFVLITQGVVALEEGCSNPNAFPASTLWGYTKSLQNENFHLSFKTIDISDERIDESRIQELFYEIWNWSDKETQVAFSGNFRKVPKLCAHKPKTNLSLTMPPGTSRFALILPETKSISDLQFGPLEAFSKNIGDEEVEVKIKAVALNFRDLLCVIQPSDQFADPAVGADFAGVVQRVGSKVTKWRVGDRVAGFKFVCMLSHVRILQDHLIPLSNKFSFCDGATLPIVSMTSVLCLLDVANIKKEDIVLIHTASGGVGLSAIDLCKHVGCTIIATAGSKRKQNYLRGLGIKYVFHSRNTQYGDQILKITHGKGVDVVLNSLTSEGFKEATLKACAKGARFIEMSKLNIWLPEEVRNLRPDVYYTIVDLTSESPEVQKRLCERVTHFFEEGIIKPVPYVRFDALHIREAFDCFQKAKHIGKVVCVCPELRNEGGERKWETPMFNENSTYLITGGLGGIGFAVCEWMVKNGAKHVLLAGRSLPSSKTEMRIKEMNARGAQVLVVQLDVGNFEECEKLLRERMEEFNLPPLRGVMHAAGTLADGMIVNQDWNKLSSTFTTKVKGTLNLHELTKTLNLEHFVVFSSVAALFGTPGQSNHAAGNAFEDAFAHYRHSLGLPATTVNWGQWGEVGIATEVDFPGVKTISTRQGLAGLEYVLNTQRLQTSIVNFDSFYLLSKSVPQLAVYVDEKAFKTSSTGSTTMVVAKSSEFWHQYDTMNGTEEKLTLVKNQLTSILQDTLKMDKTEEVGEHTSLQDMGVDSLMFIELKNGIQVLMGERVKVNTNDVKDCNTLNQLVSMLSKLIEGDTEAVSTRPSIEQVNKLIRQDSQLPPEICAKEGQKAGAVRDIKTVLLTGCTGTLGPYILKELVRLPQIKQVICLIRPRKSENLDKTLRKILEIYDLQSTVNMSKIRCVGGDVALSHLGMNSDVWVELSEKVDAVFHCAASIQHTGEHYKVREPTSNDMRAVNIGGTKNILEFACAGKLKRVYNASSLLGVFTLENDGKVSERWPEVGEFDGITTWVYPITKYVGDMLIKQAVERGIPCKVFRFPFIVGESQTGRCIIERNHLMLRYVFIMRCGRIPSLAMPLSMLPVDICAEVSIRLFFHDNGKEEDFSDIYNVSHDHPDADQKFVEVAARFGYPVELVEYSEFTKDIVNSGKEANSAIELFRDFYSENTLTLLYQNAPILKKWAEEGGEGVKWKSDKISALIPDFSQYQKPTMEYVYQNLCFCQSKGLFERYGLH